MIRAFLFDIGNVLLKFDFALAVRSLAAHSKAHDAADVLVRLDRIKVPFEDGQIDQAAFLRGAFDVLGYHGSEAQFIAAWEEIFEPNLPMIALVEQLHGRLPLYLLSNTSGLHRDYVFRKYPFFARFAGGTYSYSACASKPGRAIYETACREWQLDPPSTFFIDDLLPNIETAQALGFQTHHYHYEQHGALLDALAAAGVSVAPL